MKQWLPVLLAVTLLGANPAAAQQFFDFNGQALVPTMVGDDLVMYSIIVNNGQVDTPLPLDFANYEYTLVITGLELLVDGSTQSYGGGTITIYEDDTTLADYGNVGTFVDGTPLLIGDVLSFSRTIFFVSSGTGTGNGLVDWIGGADSGTTGCGCGIDDIHPADRLSWALVTGISGSNALPGWDENWDGKVEPQVPIVGAEVTSFGRLKAGF